jgi:hypothetical protein
MNRRGHTPEQIITALREAEGGLVNGYVESFNGKLRDEFLNGEIFYILPEAVVLVEQWKRLYNTVRPHSSWGVRPPAPETIKPSSWFLRMPQLLGPPMAQRLT